MTNNQSTKRRKLWERPWKYKESFIVALELLILGFIIEVLDQGAGIEPLQMPYNIYVAVGFVFVLIFVYTFYKNNFIVQWLSRVPAAMSAITLFTVITLMLGFIKQNDPEAPRIIQILGLTHVKTSWPLAVATIYFLTTLGFVTMRRAIPLKGKNIGFLMNHLGLWIVITTATLGSGDLKRLTLNLYEDKGYNNFAFDKERKVYRMPVSMNLLDFDVTYYPPKMAMVDARTNKIIYGDDAGLIMINDSLVANMQDWKIGVVDYLPFAKWNGETFVADTSEGASPAALVVAMNQEKPDTVAGWLASGGSRTEQKYLPLSPERILFLTKPEPKKYSSEIMVKKEDGSEEKILLEVNKPYKAAGWKFYQMSYNQQRGKWSELSVIEAISDPWLPVVYVGFFLMIGGALYLFWIGRGTKTIDEDLQTKND